MTHALLTFGHLKLRKLLKLHSIDILVVCGALFYPISILATNRTKVKVIAWEHSNFENKRDHKFQIFARKIGARYSDSIVVLTKKDEEMFNQNFENKIYQIYNPIDPLALRLAGNYNLDSKKIISVGRLSYQKNFLMLVEIAVKIHKRHPEWGWDIYGDGDELENLKNSINKNQLEDFVILKGKVSNLYDLYKDYSILVMTSRYEGFPMTLLEGLANKLPLVSFDVLTGPNEIIDDDTNGYLVKPFEIDEMAAKIISLIESKNLRLKFSNNSKIKSEQFLQKNISNKWINLFSEVGSSL